MIVDQDRIAKKAKGSVFSKPTISVRIMRKKKASAAEKRLNTMRLFFGFMLLLSVSMGAAYLAYTLLSEYGNHLEMRAKNPQTKSAGEVFYPVTYRPAGNPESK